MTYAAVRLFIDNWRWEGVPFYLRSGKRMPKRVTEIAIQFKRPPMLLFKAHAVEDVSPNVLVLRIQPDEGVSLTFEVKPPGHDMVIRPLSLDFNYEESSATARPRRMKRCSRIASRAIPRCSRATIGWNSLGR